MSTAHLAAPDDATVVLSGDLIIDTIEGTHGRLLDTLLAADPGAGVVVDCAGVTAADLTLLQVLLATARQAAEDAVPFRLTAPSAALHEAIGAAGLAAHPVFTP